MTATSIKTDPTSFELSQLKTEASERLRHRTGQGRGFQLFFPLEISKSRGQKAAAGAEQWRVEKRAKNNDRANNGKARAFNRATVKRCRSGFICLNLSLIFQTGTFSVPVLIRLFSVEVFFCIVLSQASIC